MSSVSNAVMVVAYPAGEVVMRASMGVVLHWRLESSLSNLFGMHHMESQGDTTIPSLDIGRGGAYAFH
eukprot:scaffold3605_cov430-Prasinococcus_capsulatus_cf.AAC.11